MLVVEGSWDVIDRGLGNMYQCALGVCVYWGVCSVSICFELVY